jgi:hypothetical protein
MSDAIGTKYNPMTLDQFLDYRHQERTDFSSVVFEEKIKLTSLDLSQLNFQKAKLISANFAGSNLTGALFGGANLTCANFSYSDLTNTNFSHIWSHSTEVIYVPAEYYEDEEEFFEYESYTYNEYKHHIASTTLLDRANFTSANMANCKLEVAYKTFFRYFDRIGDNCTLTAAKTSNLTVNDCHFSPRSCERRYKVNKRVHHRINMKAKTGTLTFKAKTLAGDELDFEVPAEALTPQYKQHDSSQSNNERIAKILSMPEVQEQFKISIPGFELKPDEGYVFSVSNEPTDSDNAAFYVGILPYDQEQKEASDQRAQRRPGLMGGAAILLLGLGGGALVGQYAIVAGITAAAGTGIGLAIAVGIIAIAYGIKKYRSHQSANNAFKKPETTPTPTPTQRPTQQQTAAATRNQDETPTPGSTTAPDADANTPSKR